MGRPHSCACIDFGISIALHHPSPSQTFLMVKLGYDRLFADLDRAYVAYTSIKFFPALSQ